MDKRYYAGQDIVDAIIGFMDAFGAMKEADVVKVIRCKDCGFWYVPKLEKGEKLGACGWWSGNAFIRATRAEDYCSRSVRKEG